MSRDDIIKMADASGLSLYGMGLDREKFIQYLEAFAALVASAERDRMCEQFNLSRELAHEKAKSNETN